MRILISILLLSFGLTSCYDCVECSGCVDATYNVDTALCFRDAKDYYVTKKEWRDDVKEYERLHECECQ